ncbi:MAG: TIGR01620 family protein [Aeromonadaceae bacterium]|nr:TIGR01620 family protein [Aeromonadaceae bacterium]
MSTTEEQPQPQGRVDLPLPAEEPALPHQGAIRLSESELAHSQPYQDPLASAADDLVPRALQRRRFGALGWGLAGVASLSVVQLGSFVWQSFQDSWLWGGLWAGALGLLAVGGARLLWREWRELHLLKRRQDSQSLARVLLQSNQPDGARGFCEALAVQTGANRSAGYARWQADCELHHGSVEQLRLYSQQVLSEQDRQARASISRWSGEAAVLVAISPLASVDMLLILWRSLKMIDEVAACYGIRLGYSSRIRLLRQIARHMLYAGAAELITDVGLDWLGAELSARLSARLAQGVGAGLLTARLGLQTMQVCRPIPFSADEKPRLGQIRRELLSLLASKLGRVLTGATVTVPADAIVGAEVETTGDSRIN